MSLCFAFVARGQTVLAEHAQTAGNYAQVALECLSKLSGKDSRFTFKASVRSAQQLRGQAGVRAARDERVPRRSTCSTF